VEIGEDHFVEGAWSGAFHDHSFAQATTFCGTGGLFDRQGLLLSSSTNTLQPIYVIRMAEELIASNSLALTLQLANSELKRQYRYHDVDLMSIMLGLHRYRRRLLTESGVRVALYYHCNVRVLPDLGVQQLAKARLDKPLTYAQYVGMLFHQTAAVVANASDVERRTRFRPMTTISSGYDSPACAVLARAAGCSEAMTFARAADAIDSHDDSGSKIAESLGLSIVEFDPCAYKTKPGFPEVEFLAPGYGGDDVIYLGAEAVLSDRLLFVGYHGDRVWGRSAVLGANFERGDPSGGSLQEFRLRVGFLALAVPFIGCEHIKDIRNISNSADMHPWSVSLTGYDRPIPRRLVEEAGVPRKSFGQLKKAAARPARAADIEDPPIQKFLSAESLVQFRQWSKNTPLYLGVWDWLSHLVLHQTYMAFARLASGLLKLFPASKGFGLHWLFWQRLGPVPWRYAKPRSVHSLLIFWAHEHIRARYAPFILRHRR